MTTPVEVAALAVDSLPWDGERGGVDPSNVEIARAVFESIDRDELARLIAEVDISWHAMRGLDGQEQYDITLADAVITHLTRGGQS